METTIPTSWGVDPGKWPRLVVTGRPVTPEQADNILIRTADIHYLDCNDKEWNRTVGRIVFGDEDALDRSGLPWFKEVRERARQLQVLNLEYLHTYRISSSWMGGPRGWCDWDGRIGCAAYSIGKGPGLDEVGAEWSEIAAAFPCLDLTAQLMSDEGEGELCAQWRIKDGRAQAEEIGEPLVTAEEVHAAGRAVFDTFIDTLAGGQNERGVTAERLQRAIDAVEEWVTTPAAP